MQLFRFANPQYLYLLLILPVMLVIFLLNNLRRKRLIRKIGTPALVSKLIPEMSGNRPLIKFLIMMLAVSSAVIMLARPQYGSKL